MFCLFVLFVSHLEISQTSHPSPYLSPSIVRTASMTRNALRVVLGMFKPMMQKLLNIHNFMIESK
jgi:hypothetical protein